MLFAEIAIHRPVNQTFTYHIPDLLDGKIKVGQLVLVEFGTAKDAGIVLNIHGDTPDYTTKPILEYLDPKPVVTPHQITLARWMSERYLAPIGDCLWLMLPPGIVGGRDIRVTLVDESAQSRNALQQELIELLKKRGKSLNGEQIHRVLKNDAWTKAVRQLKDAGIVTTESLLNPPRVKPKQVQVATLNIHPDHIPNYVRHLGKYSREADVIQVLADADDELWTTRQILSLPDIGVATLDHLVELRLLTVDDDDTVTLNVTPEDVDSVLLDLRQGEADLHVLRVLAREDKPVDVSWVYAQTDTVLADLRRLEERGLIWLGEKQAIRDSLANLDFELTAPPKLTPTQREVWGVIRGAIDDGSNAQSFLLHGVTGSGKTEIYLRAMERTLALGKQAILLVPEIALTAQTIRRVMARFPGRVTVISEETEDEGGAQVALSHGKLSAGERYDTWRRARAGEIGVIVGTRSALFTPLPNPGLVILDEEHDSSYKQSPPTFGSQVYYHTRDVAERMMRDNHGVLILGSATPDVGTMYRAQRGDIAYLHLPDRIMGHRVRVQKQSERAGILTRYEPEDDSDAVHIDLPPVEVVDMRNELKTGNTSIFSTALHNALTATLKRGEQAILFLNRRGTATYVFCRDCGYVAGCPRCDTPMTYHGHGSTMQCHHCGHSEAMPSQCPNCASKRIRFFGAGTQHIEAEIRAQFPDALSLRWDSDTAQTADSHDIILQRFMRGEAQVLIGTQMIAKGLDLPLVTLVGVVSADPGLNLPDFRAGERIFQLLTQVAGRAGRGLLGGRVIVQSYQPEHYVIQASSAHDYVGFYETEIAYRRELGYPPFRRMVRLLFRYESEPKTRFEAERAGQLLEQRLHDLDMTGTEMIGPVPCFFSRVNRFYRWQIFLRGANPARVLEGFEVAKGWFVDVDPVDIL